MTSNSTYLCHDDPVSPLFNFHQKPTFNLSLFYLLCSFANLLSTVSHRMTPITNDGDDDNDDYEDDDDVNGDDDDDKD